MQIRTRILVGWLYDENVQIFLINLSVSRHPRGDAERQCSNRLVSKSHLRQQALVQGKDSPRRWMWNWNSQHVRCEGRRRTCRRSELIPLNALFC